MGAGIKGEAFAAGDLRAIHCWPSIEACATKKQDIPEACEVGGDTMRCRLAHRLCEGAKLSKDLARCQYVFSISEVSFR